MIRWHGKEKFEKIALFPGENNVLLDSNIIIYAAKPENGFLRQFIEEQSPSVSAASYVEVLGYHRLSAEEKEYFEQFFATAPFLMITRAILDRAVALRQTKKMSLGGCLASSNCIVARPYFGHAKH